jgi:tRNA threonylcarbamoyl adenosine modification protein YeaZ
LLPLVDEMLEQLGRSSRDLRAVVVGRGPGTFTGVRVTVATARALSLTAAVPVVGVSTLGALAAAVVGPANGLAPTLLEKEADDVCLEGLETIVPIVDARRGQLFYASYVVTAGGTHPGPRAWSRQGPYGVCDRRALDRVMGSARALIVGEVGLCPPELPPNVVFMGRDVAAEHLVVNQESLVEPGLFPEGTRLAGWVGTALAAEDSTWVGSGENAVPPATGTPEAVTPLYVRSPDADVHITRMRDPWADG